MAYVASVSYCLNPKCPNPSDPSNANRQVCRHCGSQLLLHGRYRITQPMGGGGFGRTFEIEDKERVEKRVLKVLLKNHPKAVSLFKQEADVLSKLRHPGIPAVDPDGYFTFLAQGAKDPLHCLVMERIEGPNLQDWIKSRGNQPITQEQAIDWLKQLSDILQSVHDMQYFHRDIKPHNIMLKPNGQLVLIDFGTAREVSGTFIAKQKEGQNVTGIVSPGYTPPEQTNGKAVPQSDFFALGRTFVYLLTGKPPTAFPENPRTGKLIWHKGAPHISEGLVKVIDFLMAPFPGNRPQTPQAVLQCLAETDMTIINKQPQAPSGGNTKGGGATRSVTTSHGMKSQTSSQSMTTSGMVGKKGKKHKNKKNQAAEPVSPKSIKLPKGLLAGLAILILGLGITQVYGLSRYGLFPTNPFWLWESFSSSKYLRKFYAGNLGHINAVVPISVDGQEFLFSGSSEVIKAWNVNTDRVRDDIKDQALSLVVIPKDPPNDPTLVRSGSDGYIRSWNWLNGSRILTLTGHKGSVNTIALSPKRQWLVSGGNDRTIKFWIFGTNRLIRSINAHRGPVKSLVFTPDGLTLASAGDDRTIKLWDVKTGELKTTLLGHQGSVNSIAISPDGKFLASASDDQTVRIWDLRTGVPKVLKGHKSEVTSIAVSPDSKYIASGGQHIIVWDAKTGNIMQDLLGHNEVVSSIAFKPINLKNKAEDQKYLTIISGSLDQTIKIWKIPK